jgi:TatD DNase family protein
MLQVMLMRFADAHIHLSDEEYSGVTEEVVSEAKAAGALAIVSNSMDLRTSLQTLSLAEKNKGIVYAALGVHPWNVHGLGKNELQETLNLIREQKPNPNLIAIGEIGLDHNYVSIWEKQMRVFTELLKLGEELDLPVIIHSRGTTKEIVDILPSYGLNRVLLHWFSHPLSTLQKAVQSGYYIAEGLPVVYSKGIREVVKAVPLRNLLTETDGPVRFFKPPFKGRRTTPAFIPEAVKAIAEIKSMGVGETAEQLIANFKEFFGHKVKLA